MSGAAALCVWGIDLVLVARIKTGSDNAVRLAAILTYVGVDDRYALARSFGFAALIFSYAAVMLSMWTARARARGHEVASMLTMVHRQIGLVSLGLMAGHLAIPFSDIDPPYGGWRTSLLPFGQPVSWGIHAAAWESLGIVAFYLGVLSGPTYYLVRGRPAAWMKVHRLAAAVYGLGAAHAFLLGTDFLVRGPVRVVFLFAQVPLIAMVAARLVSGRTGTGVVRWAAAGVAAAAAVALTVLAVLAATGHVAQGRTI